MQQLTGLDASFLNMETKSTYGHVSGVAIFDPETPEGRISFQDVRHGIEERLHLLPPYRRRLVEVPFGLEHPYWIEDPDFDLDFHLRHIAVPPPGNREQLAEQVARLAARPLDRARPLWELYWIEGLEDGNIAMYTKIHHSAIDGVSGAELMTTLLDITREPRVIPPPAKRWVPDRVPGQLELLARSVIGLATQPVRALRFQRRIWQTLGERARARDLPSIALLPAVANLGAMAIPVLNSLLERVGPERTREGELIEKPDLTAPRTPFNGTISPHRRWAYGSISLSDVKKIKNAFRVTVNDVVMTLSAMTLRRWLIAHDALPDIPLLAMVPVSVRTEEEKDTLGNRVSSMMVPIPTDQADPVKALEKMHGTMKVAKEQHAAIPASLLADFAQFATPALAARAARVVARTRIADRMNPPVNVVISNVPGPGFPLYMGGAELQASYPVSAIADGLGLNITLQSYRDHLDFGLLACREMVPDLWTMMDGLGEALEELKSAAGIGVAGSEVG